MKKKTIKRIIKRITKRITKRNLRRRNTNKKLVGGMNMPLTSSGNIKKLIDNINEDINNIHEHLNEKNEKMKKINPDDISDPGVRAKTLTNKRTIQKQFSSIDNVQKNAKNIQSKFTMETAFQNANEIALQGQTAHTIVSSIIDSNNPNDPLIDLSARLLSHANEAATASIPPPPPSGSPPPYPDPPPPYPDPFAINDTDRIPQTTTQKITGIKGTLNNKGKIKNATKKLIECFEQFKKIKEKPSAYGLDKPDVDPMDKQLEKASEELFKSAP